VYLHPFPTRRSSDLIHLFVAGANEHLSNPLGAVAYCRIYNDHSILWDIVNISHIKPNKSCVPCVTEVTHLIFLLLACIENKNTRSEEHTSELQSREK